MSKRYKCLVVGCGGIAHAWMPALKAHPQVEICGLTDLRLESASALAEKNELPGTPVGNNYARMLRKTKPDFVLDLTIPAAHKDVTLKALKAGCHVLGEKPMSDSLANARKMVAAAKASGKVYMVSQNYRWPPLVRAIRKAVQDGLVGRVTTVNVDFYKGIHFGGFREEMDHPLLLDMSIHHFDLMRCMTGASPRAVYTHEFNPHGSWYKGDVSASVVFEMTDGVVFNYRGSWCAVGIETPWNGSWRIVGDKGTLIWDGENNPRYQILSDQPTLEQSQAGAAWPVRELVPSDAGSHGWKGSLDQFIESVESGRIPETDCTDNIKSLAMVFGAVSAAEKKKRIEIKD